MKFLSIISAAVLTVTVSGCVDPGATVITPNQVILAGNSFDAIELTAANYLNLPLCPKATVCRTQAVSQSLVSAVRTARHARTKLENYVNANPGQPLPVNLYQTVKTAVSTLVDLMNQNNIR